MRQSERGLLKVRLEKGNAVKNIQTRRDFLRTSSIVVGTAWAAPRFAIGKPGESANEKINVAVIGVGGMGRMAVGAGATQNPVAFCDVDERRAVESYAKHPQVPTFKDFRKMLDKHHKEIDAVLISTPDHTHYPATMAALEHGKHVFVQKPLTHDIWQARTLQKAAAYYKVQHVMGNQGHCWDGIRRVKEWYEAGLLGQVTEIHAWTDRPFSAWANPKAGFPPKKEPIPKKLDWNAWLGPVTERDYSSRYLPSLWRGWWDFGNASLGDIGCHLLDAPFWTLDLAGSPVSITVDAVRVHDSVTPSESTITMTFPARGDQVPLTLKWYEGGRKPPIPEGFAFGSKLPTNGMFMKGTKQTLYHDDMRVGNPVLLMSLDAWRSFRKTSLPDPTIPRVNVPFAPIGELYRAIKGGPTPGSNFDYAVPLTELCCLGCIALRTGKKVDYDPVSMSFADASLNRYLKSPVRPGWECGEQFWS